LPRGLHYHGSRSTLVDTDPRGSGTQQLSAPATASYATASPGICTDRQDIIEQSGGGGAVGYPNQAASHCGCPGTRARAAPNANRVLKSRFHLHESNKASPDLFSLAGRRSITDYRAPVRHALPTVD